MTDLFGHVAERPAFIDIRNQRESVAEEKARLCMELNALCKTPPPFAELGFDQHGPRLAGHSQDRMPCTGVERLKPRGLAIGHQLHAGF
jgi:hypothetical protein